MIRQAEYSKKLEADRVQCLLCPALCKLKPDQRGICRSRFNDGGTLKTDNFGETVTVAVDPIEKKPLYHFRPGTAIASIGPNGCNLSCRHCQNWQISQEYSRTAYIPPEKLPGLGGEDGSIGVAYTYTEPFIWYEYILAAAPLVREAGLVNVMVTNGYINPEPLRRMLPLIDAFNIDLKGMRPEFYTRICKGRLQPVLDVIRMVGESDAHLEVTNLIIPDENDSDEDFRRLGQFIASVDAAIPLHLSAYFPCYRMTNPATPQETLRRAYAIVKDYLTNVFVGNTEIQGCSDSRCPACGEILITRSRYRVDLVGVDAAGRCTNCGSKSSIVMSKKPWDRL